MGGAVLVAKECERACQFSMQHSICNKTFRTHGGGLAYVKSHQKNKSHREKESTATNWRTFLTDAKKSIALSSSKLSSTTKELLHRAESYTCAKACDNSDRFRFRVTFLTLILQTITIKEQQISNITFNLE